MILPFVVITQYINLFIKINKKLSKNWSHHESLLSELDVKISKNSKIFQKIKPIKNPLTQPNHLPIQIGIVDDVLHQRSKLVGIAQPGGRQNQFAQVLDYLEKSGKF